MKINVLGVHFDNITLDDAITRGVSLVRSEDTHYAVTPNPEFILDAQKNTAFQQVLNGADLVVPDGIGVIYSAKILGTPLSERVPGIELATGILAKLNETGGARLFLLGAKPGVAEEAGAALQAKFPNITICGTHDGYFKEEAPVVAQIAEAKADLLFVCLGAPRQELFMAHHGAELGAHLSIGLGGAMDVFAGRVERAPEKWQRYNLEWAYRLKKEPTRIKRMARLPLVLVKATSARITGVNK